MLADVSLRLLHGIADHHGTQLPPAADANEEALAQELLQVE